jgi:hypothetical protein
MEQRILAFDLLGDVQQVAGIEADLERGRGIDDLDLFGRAAVLRAGRRQVTRCRDRSSASPRGSFRSRWWRRGRPPGRIRLRIDLEHLVVAARDHPVVIREGAVDQLGGQHAMAEGEADLGVGQRDLDLPTVGLVEQLAHLAPSCAGRSRPACRPRRRAAASRPAPGDGRRSRPRAAPAPRRLGRMQIDAVQVIARLLGRDGEAGPVDQACAGPSARAELMRQRAARPSADNPRPAGRRA